MTKQSALKRACLCAVSNGVPRRSFCVALMVGTILNIINQGDAIFSGKPIDWLKLALTYFVPYAVCTYGAISAQLSHPTDAKSQGANHAGSTNDAQATSTFLRK
jgi:hypothetical protein